MTQRQLRWHKPSQFVSWVSNQDQPDKTTCLKSLPRSHNGRSGLTGWLVMGGVLFISPDSVIAQLKPIADDTLGNEQTIVSPNTVIDGIPSNQIDGGAQRGANLFHSFREFNIDNGRGVYFANPDGVANILTRVTGGNQSQILGTLGVLGNANLFLINPNGILFGPNAQLDISGSFLASTANSFKFPDGSEFSATNPQAPPLLTINVPLGLQYGSSRSGATITNRGDLRTGQDLQLMADKLDLQGQLIAGRDLILQAQDTVVVRDTALNPFVARSGGNLTIQGNQGIDILALSHPQYTAFSSGGNLSLLSDGLISGDAHFSSGGDFRIQSLSGQLANFTSLYDPIISSTGNVDVAANYSGASLLIESQGSVRVQGTVTIDAPDTVSTFVGEDAELGTQPGLIIRSGQTSLVYGGTSQNNPPGFTGGAVPAGITLASAVRVQPNAQGGVVRLTTAEGGITFHSIDTSSRTGGNGGTIELRAKGDITNTGSFLDPFGLSAALGSFSHTTSGDSGNGGSITLISTLGNITLNNFFSPSYSYSASGNAGLGGNISFASDSGNITLTNWYSNSNSDSASGNAGLGGNISLYTGSGDITLTNSGLGSFSRSGSGNAGSGGNIALYTSSGDITLTNSGLESFSRSNSGTAGNGGAISLTTNFGNITLVNSRLVSDSTVPSRSTFGSAGNGGAISFTTNVGDIILSNSNLFSDSRSRSTFGSAGNGGAISFTTNVGDIILSNSVSDSYSRSNFFGSAADGGAISFTTNVGDITLSNSRSDSVSGSLLNRAGNGGIISFATNVGNITLTDLSSALSYSYSGVNRAGDGGAISFTTNVGDITLANNSVVDSDSRSFGSAGNGGVISFTTNVGDITLTNSSVKTYSASSSGSAGNGGAIFFATSSGDITFIDSSADSYSVSQSGAAGNGGAISLVTDFGNITFRTTNPNNPITLNSYSGSESGSAGSGGAIYLSAREGAIAGNNSTLNSFAVSQTDRSGDGGMVTLEADRSISGLTIKTVASGENSGNVQINGFGNLLIDSTNILTAQQLEQRVIVDICLEPPCSSPNNLPLIVDINLILASGKGQAGNVRVDSIGNLTFSNSLIQGDTLSGNPAGNITITSPGVVSFDNSQVISNTSSAGPAGSITVNAAQIQLNDAASGLFAQTNSRGVAGNITLQPFGSDSLTIQFRAGAQISASTISTGQGGSVLITAPQAIALRGNGVISAGTGGSGAGGNVQLVTKQLDIQGNINLSASTASDGKAGDVGVNAEALTLSGGAKISTNTSSNGSAGDLNIQVNDQLFLIGQGTGLFASTTPGSTGTGGNITINSRLVQIEDEATLAVNSDGSGIGGNISLQADRLELNRKGSITAETLSNTGGNITLNLQDLLLLRNGSQISTTAGNAQFGGDGGNITFNGNFIVAVPKENSDISANAYTGNGGRVDVTAQGIFGTQFRPQLTPLSDITASSEFGVAGVVSINTPDVDPNRGLVQLPVDVTDASRLIVQTCPTGNATANQSNEFVVTGRGGLPPTPSEAVNRDAIQVDLVTTNAEEQQSVSPNQPDQTSPPRATPPTGLTHTPLVEAQSWQLGADGKVILVASAPQSPIAPSPNRPVHCP